VYPTLIFYFSFVDRDMFTRYLGNGVGHQCQHTANGDEVVINSESEDDHSDDEGNCANEDEDLDIRDSTEEIDSEDSEDDNTEEGDEFSDEDDTGYDGL
jgi:hypothetical protein